VFARLAARISAGKKPRRQSLKTILPVAADIELESRLMLSASSDDEVTEPEDAVLGDDSVPGGDENTLQITMTMFMIDDTVDVGYEVGAVVPTGGDGSSITFSMDDPSGMFAIDPNTGMITVVNQNDWHSGDSYAVTFYATQSGETVEQTVTIMLAVSGWSIAKPTGDENLLSSKDIEVEVRKPADRNANYSVRIRLQRRESDGTWTAIDSKEWSAANSRQRTTLTHTFGKQAAGKYRILWEKQSGSGWAEQDKKEFRIVD
jgi:hypothetical protein